MKRIIINNTHVQWANEYLANMLYKRQTGGNLSPACRLLNELSDAIIQKWYVVFEPGNNKIFLKSEDIKEYIQLIVSKYTELLTCHPESFENIVSVFNNKIPTDKISILRIEKRRGIKGQDKKQPYVQTFLHEELVRCMRYNHVQARVFPYYIRKMGIKTCVYCNAQYAITTKKKHTAYQLDHCLPKSKYPYLCTNFFNLQPSCGSCNLGKSNNDMVHGDYSATIWKEKNDKSVEYFNFTITDFGIVKYLLSGDPNNLSILFNVHKSAEKGVKSLYEDFNKFFHIQDIYEEHKDVVEEIIWKKYAYSSGYMSNLASAFSPIANEMTSDFMRFIMGNYMIEEHIYKRPLSKMIQDIAKQLHLDFGFGVGKL